MKCEVWEVCGVWIGECGVMCGVRSVEWRSWSEK